MHANTCVYVTFLDVKKAFHSVWINGMLYKHIKLGVDKILLRIICDSYNGLQCTVVFFLSSLFPNKVFTQEIFFYIVFITMTC